MLVVGDREAEAGAVSVRLRSGEDLKSMPLDRFTEIVTTQRDSRSIDLIPEADARRRGRLTSIAAHKRAAGS